jgi:hypothetical protein
MMSHTQGRFNVSFDAKLDPLSLSTLSGYYLRTDVLAVELQKCSHLDMWRLYSFLVEAIEV